MTRVTKSRKVDESNLKKFFVGKKVEGWKFDFNYSVTITPEGFVTRSGELFENLQPAVNKDIFKTTDYQLNSFQELQFGHRVRLEITD